MLCPILGNGSRLHCHSDTDTSLDKVTMVADDLCFDQIKSIKTACIVTSIIVSINIIIMMPIAISLSKQSKPGPGGARRREKEKGPGET